MATQNVTRVSYTFAIDSLFGPETDLTGIDVEASYWRYADLTIEALVEAFPGADVTVRWDAQVDWVSRPWGVETADGYYEQGDDFVTYEVSPVIDHIWEDGAWLVMTEEGKND